LLSKSPTPFTLSAPLPRWSMVTRMPPSYPSPPQRPKRKYTSLPHFARITWTRLHSPYLWSFFFSAAPFVRLRQPSCGPVRLPPPLTPCLASSNFFFPPGTLFFFSLTLFLSFLRCHTSFWCFSHSSRAFSQLFFFLFKAFGF